MHSHHSEINKKFAIAIIANSLFVVVQIVFSYLANSTSLFADAIHNLGDVLSIILAGLTQSWIRRPATNASTYGLKKTSILSALTNGLVLVFTSGIIVTEAIYKFIHPSSIEANVVIWVALIGIFINGTTALLFIDHKKDLNLKATFLHLIYDALVSVGVLIAGVIFYWTHWQWVDPIVGIIIAIVILKGTWSIFTESFRLLIDKVPRNISFVEIYEFFKNQKGVEEIHDLHIWALSTQENALSVHLFMPVTILNDQARHYLITELKEKYNIHHTTIQVEQTKGFCNDCS